uniref:Uncharacterized protein n=1 Tax=Peronospora matthiolae TaxID=2874970 RepID=A0AAV1T1I3_9STRA
MVMEKGDNLLHYYNEFPKFTPEKLVRTGIVMEDEEVDSRLLRSLPERYDKVVRYVEMIRQKGLS